MKRKHFISCGATASFLLAAIAATTSAYGAAFTPGDYVVTQVGDGSGALSSAAAPVFLDEYTPLGVFVQQIALPTAASSGNLALTMSGTATSEGFLQMSANGQYMVLAGYNAAPATPTITSALASVVNRVAGLVSLNGTIDTTTSLNQAVNVGNPRSIATVDGTAFYVATSAAGIQYVAYGAPAAGVQLSSTPSNTRVVETLGGQLYTSSASGAFQGPATVGTGLPTTSGQTTTLLNGFPTATGPSPYQFFISGNNAWVADDRTAATGGGIQHWTLSAGTWSLAYTMGTNGFRSFTIDTSGANPVIDAVAASSTSPNSVYSLTDTGSGSAGESGTILFTDPTGNTVFRGIVEIPSIPEPSTAALLGGFGILAWVISRRRR